jgi:recombinational DNA repair protein RecR
MNRTDKILLHYKTKYSSSPVEISSSEIKIIIKNKCECWRCSKSIFEMDDFPNIKNNTVYCEDCYSEEFETVCPICEEIFEKAEKASDYYFVVSKEASKICFVKPGIYKAKFFPIFYGNCVTGFDAFFEDNIELIRELDINSMKDKLIPHTKHNIRADEICIDLC